MMHTLARKSANPGHMSPKFLRCAGCMDCASRRGRILREGGAKTKAARKSKVAPGHSFLGSLGPARRCSRSAEQSPPESGVASTAPSLAANQWAWLKPHPQLLAEGAAIAVALHRIPDPWLKTTIRDEAEPCKRGASRHAVPPGRRRRVLMDLCGPRCSTRRLVPGFGGGRMNQQVGGMFGIAFA